MRIAPPIGVTGPRNDIFIPNIESIDKRYMEPENKTIPTINPIQQIFKN